MPSTNPTSRRERLLIALDVPADFALRAEHEEVHKGDAGRARIVADYIAGMTDRYATKEFQRLA